MASTIKVDKIEGSTGSTITVPTGQTLTLTDGLAVASLPVVTVAKGGTNIASFAAGDLLYATGSTTLAKLTKGTAEQVLAMNSGATAPDWGSVDLTVLPTITVAKGGTNLSSFTAGDILYATGATTLAKLAKGTTLQQLRMNSAATAPEWATIAAGGTTPNFFVRKNTDQTGLTPSVDHKITWQVEDWDSDSAFDLANDKFIVPSGKAGKYQFSGCIYWVGWGNNRPFDDYRCNFYINGTLTLRVIMALYGYIGQQSAPFIFHADLSVADYVELYAWSDQGSGTTGSVGGGVLGTHWGGHFLG